MLKHLSMMLTLASFGVATAIQYPTVTAVIMDEVDHIAAQVDLPEFAIYPVKPFDRDAYTLITGKPVKYVVTIVAGNFWRETRVRWVVGHELGHVMLAHLGLPQSEEAADGFADCYGTVKTSCAVWEAYTKGTAK